MSGCPPGFAETARTLGEIDCANAPPVVSVRPPTSLADGTMPVVEAFMVVGAGVALVHAVLWWRRRGDPTNLGLWCATLVYLVVLEPPLYFPQRFGLQDQLGLIFVHNVFSVQLLYDRLPLYIVAVYPALTYAAYALVQRTGLLERHSPAAGAACVAVVFHCFYEIFDQLGPQLRWWAWNPGAPSNSPWLAAVPVSSVVVFAAASPFGMVLLTRLLLARRPRPPAAVLRVVGVGVLTPFAMMLCSVPYGVLSRWLGRSDAGQAVALWAVLAVLVLVAALTVGRDVRSSRDFRPDDGFLDRYPVVAGAAFLLVFAGLWAVALPDYLNATAGLTPAGTPIGSLGYAAACALVATGVLVAVSRAATVTTRGTSSRKSRTDRSPR
ncbi:DUF7802 domain-containing protein [Couchioplanes caeruleus]|uniref:DUF7802 domain-containing protein n=2 Tax=Couchioplanes caeruleus TaxID=56438 RepID=A0A1K0FBA5_9ACTN|nr:hypothetical protein [Couchioplanes caeruleus]OJF10133.1 hypothetical protein BG844_33830 [Couchioplanes caeruleus subsp. caeruleus]ROP33882.1 hypothetical protein EDD30_6936 [Couchioplanes caeruleus]